MNIMFKNVEDKYSIESKNIKVVYSNPTIQPWDDYGYCKDERGIFHYYYNVDVYIMKNNKWKKIFDLSTYDFPQILAFKEILKLFIDDVSHYNHYQRIGREDGNYWLIKTFDVDGLFDDYYAVKHEIYMEDNIKRLDNYEVVIGKPLSVGSSEIESVIIKNLTKSDLEIIYDCVKGFIEYTIQKNNELVISRNKKILSSWKIKEGHLYETSKRGKCINSVYIVGDTLNGAKVLCGDMGSKEFYSNEFHDIVISDIVEDGLIISSGYVKKLNRDFCKISTPLKIDISCLLDVFQDVSDEKLGYNEEAIIKDFIGVLSQSDREEFREKSIDFLYNKWKEALINRTWMCREEHNLPNRVKDNGNHENVYASVKAIIGVLKERLCENI